MGVFETKLDLDFNSIKDVVFVEDNQIEGHDIIPEFKKEIKKHLPPNPTPTSTQTPISLILLLKVSTLNYLIYCLPSIINRRILI